MRNARSFNVKNQFLVALIGGAVAVFITFGYFLLEVRDFTIQAQGFPSVYQRQDVQAVIDAEQNRRLDSLVDDSKYNRQSMDKLLERFGIPKPTSEDE